MKLTVEERYYSNGMVQAVVRDGRDEIATIEVAPKSKDGPSKGGYEVSTAVRVPDSQGAIVFNVVRAISRTEVPAAAAPERAAAARSIRPAPEPVADDSPPAADVRD